MRIVIKNNNTTLLHAVFALWLFCELMFEHTIISQAALLIFVGITVLVTYRVRWSMVLTGYCLFALWSAANILFGHATSVSVASKMTRTLFLNVLFLFAFVNYCRHTRDYFSILRIYKWIAVIFSIRCLLGGIGGVLEGYRLSVSGINANRLATVLAYAMIILTYELLKKEKSERGFKDYAALVLFVITIILTGSRKGLLIPFVGIYLLICARRPKKILKYSLITVAVILVVMHLIMNVKPLYDILGFRVEAVLQFLQQEEFDEGSLATRDKFITLGWELAQLKPIWGHGLDCFRLLKGSYGTYSHSNYIEILYSLGWVGLLLYYFPHVYYLVRLLATWKKKLVATNLLLALFVPFLVCDYMNVTYFERLYLLIPAIVITVLGEKGVGYENKKTD